MVKKGEFLEYALWLGTKVEDVDVTSMKSDAYHPSTEMAIVIEMAQKIQELEKRIADMESQMQEVKR